MIRTVTLNDAAEITDIYNRYILETVITFETEPLTAEMMRRRISDISACHPYLVMEEDDGHIAGYCYAHPWKERQAFALTLEATVYLAPASQHRGIGTQLMEHLIEECRKRGYTALIACITAGNEASEAMVRRLGFRQVSHFEKVGFKFGRQLDVNDYELLLTPHR